MRRIVAYFLVLVLSLAYSVNVAHAANVVRDNFDETFYSGNDILFYDPRCSSGVATGYITLSGKDNLEKILTFFMQKGLTLAQASGIAGNFMAESGLDPTIIQGGGHATPGSGYTPTSGVGFGLAQWTSGGRQQALVAETQRLGVDITDLGAQLAFAWKEISEQYPGTLTALRATTNPVEAAVVVHDGYESSADSRAAVINNRGGNSQKFYTMYADAPALAGSTSSVPSTDATMLANTNPSPDTINDACVANGYGNGNLQQMVSQYAWSKYISGSTRDLAEAPGKTVLASDQKPAYAQAVTKALSEGRYVGGIAIKGDDCGGFVTTLMHDSGFDKGYNYNARGGYTYIQMAWLKANWESIPATDASNRRPGDVAINGQHTYVYVGNIKGFGDFDSKTKIASSSVSGPIRAPMAGAESPADGSFQWFRKKTNLTAAPL